VETQERNKLDVDL